MEPTCHPGRRGPVKKMGFSVWSNFPGHACLRNLSVWRRQRGRFPAGAIMFKVNAAMPAFDKPLSQKGHRAISGEELVILCGLTPAELDELVEYGSLAPPTAEGFQPEVVSSLREALRVRALFDLDLFTAGLLLQYLRTIEQLECEVRGLRDRLAGSLVEREVRSMRHSPPA